MTVTITDPATLAALAAIESGVEVRGPDGQFLGRFVPSLEATLAEFGLTAEEYHRRLNAPDSDWATGEEVMARLRSLRNPT